ncbi:MAG: hypothetical protein IMZ46_02210 [Acidobacteria bacterium]|nr:hypothetical protein [Acidobacteriota bacterium]
MNDIERLRGVYGAAGRDLRRSLLAVDPANYSDVRAAAARAKAADLVRTLNVAADRWATEAIARSYAKSARVARTTLEILGRRPRRKNLVSKPRLIADELMVTLLRANNSIPVTVDRYLAAASVASRAVGSVQVKEFKFAQAEVDVKKMAADAVKTEISHKELAGEVRDYLYDLVQDDQFIEINGRMYKMSKYAELVARYELGAAATAATLDLCREYENDLVEWSDHGTICDECKPFEGQIYSISGMDPDYPPLEETPPIHPNCEHGLLPTSREAIEARDN